jgi:DNA polymerase-3 subunit delta'
MSWQIVGHDWAVALLRRGLETGRVAHAYLFTGPPQIGKTRLALTLAQALNCAELDPPCGRCPSCLRLERGTHPDVRLVEGEGAGGSIKIDQIRTLQREAALSPYEGRYRVFILRRMDLASIEAANSLLKTLEEPPEPVVLVLTAVQGELLPPTVVSRCQRFDLRPTARDVIEASLREKGVPAPKAQLLARLSGGRVGWVFHATQDDRLLHQRQEDLDQLQRILSWGRVERLDFAWEASRDPVASRALIELWTAWWRDLLLLHGDGKDHIVNVDRSDELCWVSRQSSLPQVQSVLNALQETVTQLDANVNPRLALEGLLLKLPHWQTLPKELPKDQTVNMDN